MIMEKEMLENQYRILTDRLKEERNTTGFWSGKLSSSALSTATALVALKINGNSDDVSLINTGFNWLCSNINNDGGYGDTPDSSSNVSTSLLCYAAVYYCRNSDNAGKNELDSIKIFLETKGISFNTLNITSSILKFYGNDYTFSVPILSMLTLCGVLSKEAFSRIPRLPFELSLLPASYYRFFNLQVVSYAVPALIGVGIYLHTHHKPNISISRVYRDKAVSPSIKKLTSLLPESGGFLEAVPLTAFVDMCLIASDKKDNVVVKKGIVFLRNQQRNDGSWPIDTDLSTWVTTLAIKALGSQLKSVLGSTDIDELKAHLINIQYKEKHSFNGANPGGWGWTNYSGSVPDADDTPGAILALLEMFEGTTSEIAAIINGCIWLEELQNSDGGFPTFCRGWGRLPFDSSCADLTGHAILAFVSSLDKLGNNITVSLQKKLTRSIKNATEYLYKHQAEDGSWLPLWFGNQLTEDKKNPVYGTAKVCIYLEDCITVKNIPAESCEKIAKMTSKAQQYLISQQNKVGSWGGAKGIDGTTEETALAISALTKKHQDQCICGFEWLAANYRSNDLKASPIGLYFAALWYDEKMYPLIYYIEALRRVLFKNGLSANTNYQKINIKILGAGCAKCETVHKVTVKVVRENQLNAEVVKIEDIKQIMNYNIISTPAIVINEKVVFSGRVPSESEIKLSIEKEINEL
jgi:small redox-active disulfide protein 2